MVLLISDAFDPSLAKKLEAFGEVTTDKSRLSEATVVLVRFPGRIPSCQRRWMSFASALLLQVGFMLHAK